ncbi:hypothetical protein LOK49_LG01G00004 [Camellia lanceoleosa]|uniref:Uncharacterized protein n=1 Tax=Camellia lanceoleosa TaxID=1840588 RepID=A0ACC0IZL8_9ERIC|nr:hypothetical protein LOK49_LG01G00004 [Camellia lanceoleosa]
MDNHEEEEAVADDKKTIRVENIKRKKKRSDCNQRRKEEEQQRSHNNDLQVNATSPDFQTVVKEEEDMEKKAKPISSFELKNAIMAFKKGGCKRKRKRKRKMSKEKEEEPKASHNDNHGQMKSRHLQLVVKEETKGVDGPVVSSINSNTNLGTFTVPTKTCGKLASEAVFRVEIDESCRNGSGNGQGRKKRKEGKHHEKTSNECSDGERGMISSSSIKVELTSPIIAINSNQNEVSGAVHLFDHNKEDVKKKREMDDGCCSKDLNSEIVSPCPPKGVKKVINVLEKTRQSSFLIKGKVNTLKPVNNGEDIVVNRPRIEDVLSQFIYKGSFQQNGQDKNCVKSPVLYPHSEKVTIKENGDVEDNKQKRTESSFVAKKKINPFSSTNMKVGEENLNETLLQYFDRETSDARRGKTSENQIPKQCMKKCPTEVGISHYFHNVSPMEEENAISDSSKSRTECIVLPKKAQRATLVKPVLLSLSKRVAYKRRTQITHGSLHALLRSPLRGSCP